VAIQTVITSALDSTKASNARVVAPTANIPGRAKNGRLAGRDLSLRQVHCKIDALSSSNA
jgi:hypothetical protein